MCFEGARNIVMADMAFYLNADNVYVPAKYSIYIGLLVILCGDIVILY